MNAGRVRLMVVVMAAVIVAGCNGRTQQCERLAACLAETSTTIKAAARGPMTAATMDQLIFAMTRAKGELAGLDLPDVQLNDARLRYLRVVDDVSTALRAFAAVRANHDAADAEDLLGKLQATERDQRAVLDDLKRYCIAP